MIFINGSEENKIDNSKIINKFQQNNESKEEEAQNIITKIISKYENKQRASINKRQNELKKLHNKIKYLENEINNYKLKNQEYEEIVKKEDEKIFDLKENNESITTDLEIKKFKQKILSPLIMGLFIFLVIMAIIIVKNTKK